MTTLADAIANPAGTAINGAIGRQAAAGSKSVALATDDSTALANLLAASGANADAAWTSGNGTLISLLKAIAGNAISTKPSPVVGPGSWETVAASQTDQVMGATGAAGDFLSHVLIVPATTSPGAVSIKDGSGSAITIFTGGASSVSNLVPFAVPLGLTATAAWKITTNANVSAIGVGLFT